MHLARCGIVCKDKKYGSFGIRRLKVFNQALLSKWLSRFANEHDILWRKFIQAKYGEMDGGWSTLGVRGSFGISLLWKTVRRS